MKRNKTNFAEFYYRFQFKNGPKKAQYASLKKFKKRSQKASLHF